MDTMLTYNTNSNTGPVCGGRADRSGNQVQVKKSATTQINKLIFLINTINYNNEKKED